jgi:hypothetical protein
MWRVLPVPRDKRDDSSRRVRLLFAIAVAALAPGCGGKRDAAAMCERVNELAHAPGADPSAFRLETCLDDAARLAHDEPDVFDCYDRCSHHLGYAEFALCAKRCEPGGRSKSAR